MKLLREITDADLGLGPVEQLGTPYELRKSARGVVCNESGAIAVQYLATYDYYKLPGGGVDQGETLEAALRRELEEEVGCQVTDIEPLGLVIEYRDRYKLLHISYGYSCRVDGTINPPALEPAEIAEGMRTVWLDPAEALEKIQARASRSTDRYESHFHRLREEAIVAAYLQSLGRLK